MKNNLIGKKLTKRQQRELQKIREIEYIIGIDRKNNGNYDF